MVFFWIILISLLLYGYYAVSVNAQLAADLERRAVREPAPTPPAGESPGVVEEHDYLNMDALTRRRAPEIPAMRLAPDAERTYRGGAAGRHPNVFASGMLDLTAPPLRRGDRRETHRREEPRRASDRGEAPEAWHPDRERRLASRRVWLRRTSDCGDLDLVDIEEAARMLAATPEQIDKWIRSADLPFYMVTNGVVREMRFDRAELLGWMGADDVVEARARRRAREDD